MEEVRSSWGKGFRIFNYVDPKAQTWAAWGGSKPETAAVAQLWGDEGHPPISLPLAQLLRTGAGKGGFPL